MAAETSERVSGGLYELRAAKLTTMAVDVSGGSLERGANVQLYASNDTNAQKFLLAQESDGVWTIQNLKSSMLLDASGAKADDGTNVIQWPDNSGANQRWRLSETGESVSIDGYECLVVTLGSYVTEDGTSYMLDVDHAMTTNKSNVQIWHANGTVAQQFALLPTTPRVDTYPVPADVGWATRTTQDPFHTLASNNRTEMLLGWTFPTTWTPTDVRMYERRVRSRRMDAVTSTWSEWGAWSQWQDVDAVVREEFCYDANPIDPHFDMSQHKAVEFQAQVRCKIGSGNPGHATTGEGSHGPSVTGTLRNIVDPTMTPTGNGSSEKGFVLNVASNYVPARFTITSMDVNGIELLSERITADITSGSRNITIPWESLSSIPDAGATATITYQRGTDLFDTIAGTRTATMVLDYGDAPVVPPTLTIGKGRVLNVTHPSGVTGTWVSDGTGVKKDADGRNILYPFGQPSKVLVTLGNGTTYVATIPQQQGGPVHAFNWKGGSFLLECDTDPLVTDRTIEADYEAFSLNKRQWQSVHFTDVLTSEFSVVGLLYKGVTESTVDDLMAMLRQRHVTYRAPSGEVALVAVVGANYQTHREFTKVEVNLIQETR